MSDFFMDLRLAARQMAQRPGIHALAILSLALGIGVNSAMFTLVNAVLFHDPPAAAPERLVEVYMGDSDGFAYATSSYPDFRDLRRQNDVFSELAAYETTVVSYDDGRQTELLFAEMVSGNYFDLLGVSPVLGRGFRPEEDATPGTHPVAVLSYGLWRQRFAADPGVLGRVLKLNGVDFTIIGVAPPELTGSFPAIATGLWLPLQMNDAISESPSLEKRGRRSLFLRARLAPGATVEQAQAQMTLLAQRLAAAYPETNEGRALTVVPSREVALNPGLDGPIFGVAGLLMGVVALVLLIACSNIANLLLARAADRRREVAVRLALGAGRWRLTRQLLAESLLLAGVGGGLGLLLALGMARLMVSFRPPLPLPLALDVGLDARVLAFTLALALATGLICGLAPAWRASRPQLVPALKDEAGSLGGRHRLLGLRNLLVVGQVAVSAVLLIGAGLFVNSLLHAQAIDPGFTLRRGATVQVGLGFGSGYSEERGRAFFRQLVERAESLPGVRSAALAEHLPLGFAIRTTGVGLEGGSEAEDDWPEMDTTGVGPGYFETLGIAVPWGRAFNAQDGPDTPGVVMVNETAARRFWPGENPLGKRVRFDEEGPWFEIVGVAADGKYRTLGEAPRPFIYRCAAQDYSSFMTLVAASDADERATLGLLRREIEALDPNLPIFDQRTMSEHLAFMLFPARFGAGLLAAFGGLGLLLAAVGLYGVVAYSVSRRTREVGIRMALGARGGDVLGLVVREGMTLVAIGLALGIGLALVAARLLDSLLYGIGSRDPATFTAVALLLLAVAALANLLPARRAVATDPLKALRYE